MPLAWGVAMRVRVRTKFYTIFTSPILNSDALKQAILEEPELAGEILRTVNSPFYGLVQPVESLSKAILYLEHREARNIIWRLYMQETSGQDLAGEAQKTMENLWNHSFIVSRGSYMIAKNLRVGDTDHARLGHEVARMWGLPDKITMLVEDHHYPAWASGGAGIDDPRSAMVV